jgi:hypothetical protein
MKLPNLALMQHYGTAGVFQEKTAGASPFASRVAAAVFTGGMIGAAQHGMALQQMEAHQLNEQFRLIEQRNMAPALENLRHTRAPMFVPAGSDLPVGWDEGMVRLASIAHGCGSDMAKLALGQPPTPQSTMPGIGPQKTVNQGPAPATPVAKTVSMPGAAPAAAKSPGLMRSAFNAATSPLGRKALGWGAVLGGGYLALKGVNAGLNTMSRPAPTQTYGGGGFGGYQVPMGVNQYGYPQAGTSLVG